MNFRHQQERENATFFLTFSKDCQKSKVNGSSGRDVDFGSFYAPLTINTLFSTSFT